MRITFIVLGTEKTKRKLKYFSRRGAKIADPIMWKWAEEQRQRIRRQKYPPKRAGQTYNRTGNLANRWAKVRITHGYFKVVNRNLYASYVVGRATQAWMHAGRWWVADDIWEEGTAELIKSLEDHYVRTWRTA